MVSIEEIQAAYYMVAATGVLVAAAFYVLNLRETTKNRRTQFVHNMLQVFYSEEVQQHYGEVINMQWIDFEDFKKKYDSSANTQFFAKRTSVWSSFNALGQQYRNGIISLDAFDSLTSFSVVLTWLKFKPIIEGYRRWQYPKDALSDFEYLANALQKRLSVNDPSFMEKMNTFFTTPPANQ